MNTDIYAFKTAALDGGVLDFSQFKGRTLLLVNTASRCGFTPQYAELETLYRRFQGDGLVVIGFPCNQFGGQEPGDSADIAAFCQKNYGVSFPLSEKVEVNGPNANPLFAYLTHALPGAFGLKDIKWNFTKFLVDGTGKPVRRYAPWVRPEKIGGDIQRLLG